MILIYFVFLLFTFINFGSNKPIISNNYSSFITYDEQFNNIFGLYPKLEIIAYKNYSFAHEAGVFLEETNEIYFTSNRLGNTTTFNQYVEISKINLDSNEITIVKPNKEIIMANGGTYYKGNIIFCSQGLKNIGGSIVSYNPKTNDVKTIVDNYFGLKFNSPNDIVVSKNGYYWFTDPSYGYEQNIRTEPQLGEYVYVFNPYTNNIRVVSDGFIKPNGIAFSQDEKILYITDTGYYNGTGNKDVNKPHTIYAFDVNDYFITNKRIFAVIDSGIPDGIKVDKLGNVYTGTGDGVQIFNKNGSILGKIIVKNGISNIFLVKNKLYMLGENFIYSIKTRI